jgi:hypothetical protein
VQSELDLLPATQRRVTILLKGVQPAEFLEKLRKDTGLKIEVTGKLPAGPALSATFRDAEARKVLTWFAQQLPVSFRAEPPDKLWVVVDEPGSR